ncbi:ENTH domain-containing protein [Coniochaeta sp. 2T2.1]|nr:ENTH domain-containing protein [Coniochaeta sp. 2T2.1]
MSKVIRSVKNVTKGYSSVQVKVREATSNDPWGPTGTQMSEIAQLTYNSSTEFYEIMDMLDKRLNDKGKNWRHVLKALKVLDYCLHEGSELVVTWAKQNLFIIKTLREFQYIDEDGRDVGQNVRVASKELTQLLLDEERLRAERSDRKTWKSRVTGLEEYEPRHSEPSQPRRPRQMRPQHTDEEDAEYKLAIEASKYQEEEDRRKRESRGGAGAFAEDDDDDLAKAIKLSKEEEERRRRELEDNNATSLFDDEPAQQPQPTGYNQGYQQGSAVDFFANPIDQQPQPTGYNQTAYTGFQTQPTGYQNGYQNGFGAQPTGFAQQQQPTGYDMYQQQMQQPMQTAFQPQQTGYNPYAQQQQPMQSPTQQEPVAQAGSNNPWATGNPQSAVLSTMKPLATGSNNPFAQQQQTARPSFTTLNSLPEQKTLSSFSQQPSFSTQPSFGQQQPSSSPFSTQPQQQQQQQQQQQPQKELSEHEARLNALLLNAEQTGNNPFLRQQFTGMPTVSYQGQQGQGQQQQMPAATGPANFGQGVGSANPFGQRGQQQQGGQGDLIQF